MDNGLDNGLPNALSAMSIDDHRGHKYSVGFGDDDDPDHLSPVGGGLSGLGVDAAGEYPGDNGDYPGEGEYPGEYDQQQQQQYSPQQQQQQQGIQSPHGESPGGGGQLPVITPDDLPPDMREAFDQLDPEQQRQALEMLAQQQLEQQQMEEMRPEEHFLTIALNGA